MQATKVKHSKLPSLRFSEYTGEWAVRKANDLFFNSREKGDDSLPIYSVTIDNGLVPRDTLERKMKNDAKPKDNLAVCTKEIAYNMMRMWQGAFGLAHRDCMVSPAYIVLRAKPSVSAEFFIQLFNCDFY